MLPVKLPRTLTQRGKLPRFFMPMLEEVLRLLLVTVLPGVLVSLVMGRYCREYSALGLLGGMIAGNLVCNVLPWWPSSQEMSWLILALVLNYLPLLLKPGWRWLSAPWVGLLSLLLIHGESREMVSRLGYCVFCMLLCYSIQGAERWLRPSRLMILNIASGLAGCIILYHAHSALLAQIMLLWSCSCLGLLIACWKRVSPLMGIAAPCSLFVPYLLDYGTHNSFSQVPGSAWFLAVFAPCCCLLLTLNSNSPLLRGMAVAGWLVFLCIAAGLAIYFEDPLIIE
jgi:hypothetical protein